ncbi:MAG: 4Fe-4S ferredoxin [Rhodospirillales bacterium]|nr:4Fe-4S ferredoxin [Rhodospirillales bacterium]
MKVHGRRVLVCNCERTMTPDAARIAAALGAEAPVVHSHLCRTQIDAFREAVGGGEPLLVCCTQEAALFGEVAVAVRPDADVAFVNIRERAGWSAEGRRAHAKMAALIAEAALDIPPTPAVTIKSAGVCLVYGPADVGIAAARRVAGRLSVTCLVSDGTGALPPSVRDVALFAGRIREAKGHMGAFEVVVDGFAVCRASAREALAFEAGRDGARSICDVILDLSGGAPLFPAADKRDGYVRAEPSDPVAIQRALFDIADLVGEFEKPRYVRVDPSICAHSRNGIVGCTNCLDVCPTAAITPVGDHTAVDAPVCSGHGACASVCPTGAIVFDLPRGPALFERLRVLTRTYRNAGGGDMVLLIHDPRHGDEMIDIIARTGGGLPANVVPFPVTEITMVGLDLLLTALAYGVAQVRILAAPEHRDALDPLRRHAELVETVMTGLGYVGNRIVIGEAADPGDLERDLAEPPPPSLANPATHRVTGEKRTTLTLALDHLRRDAPEPVDVLALPAGAPFGEVRLSLDRCTLCLACVGVCPMAALGDNPDRPQLTFTEINCVQCGLCRNTCPENAIALTPRLNFAAGARRPATLKEEAPFHCIRCGKPFGTQSTITRLVERLAGHSMFAGAGRIDAIKMCEDCRVIAQFDAPQPMAGGQRPRPRTTDDDLRERERDQVEKQRAAGIDPADKTTT